MKLKKLETSEKCITTITLELSPAEVSRLRKIVDCSGLDEDERLGIDFDAISAAVSAFLEATNG